MRKTFKFVCAAALSLLAVSSCGKIEDSLNDLKAGLENLTARVEKLEQKLNDEVSTLNSKISAMDAAYKAADAELLAALQNGDEELAASITTLAASLDALDGKVDGFIETDAAAIIAAIEELQEADEVLAELDSQILAALVNVGVTKVEKNAAGNAVLTFTDGSTLEVPAQPANGVVTVVVEDGVMYWAVIVDGEPVSLEVPVGHNELEFMVDEDGALLFSVDGGANWDETGAYVAEDAESLIDFYQGSEWDDDLWEEVVDDYYTLVFGGETYYLPLYKVDNSVVTIKAGKTYFEFGESKTIEVALTDVKDMYVMTKPDGWRANLDGKKLVVTAPSEDAIEAGYAETDGEVLLHCTTVEGKCKVARLAVATSLGFSLTVDEEGNVKIVNPNVVTSTDHWGEEMVDFQDAYIGLAPVTEFEADPAAYLANAPYDYSNVTFMMNVWKSNTMDWETGEFTVGGPYVPGEYEVDVIETTVADIYSYYNYGDEIEAGARFVVWACPVNEMGEPNVGELVFGYFSTPVVGTIEATETTFTDVELSVEVKGASSFYVGLLLEEYMYGFPIDSYMLNQQGPFGYFQMAIQYGMPEYAFSQMGNFYENEGEAVTVTASELNYGSPLLPNSKFYVWVFPVVDGLALENYTYEENLKPYIYEFTTSGITAGGSLVATLGEETTTYTDIKVPVSVGGASLVYYNFYDVDEYNEVEDVAADLMENGYVTAESEFIANANDLAPNTSRVLAVIAVDAEGKYGDVVEAVFTTKQLVYSTTFVATVGTPEFVADRTNWKVNMPVSVTGGDAAKYYYYWNATSRTEEQLNNLPLKDYYYYYEATTIPQLVYYSSNASYQFAVVVESTTGELSKPVIITVNKPSAE